MRRLPIIAAAIALVSGQALAQVKPPPRLEPIPEPPPASIGIDNESPNERGIRLSPGAGDRVEEIFIDGKRTIRVTNPSGYEYYIVEELGDSAPAGQTPHDSRVRVPMWRIFSF